MHLTPKEINLLSSVLVILILAAGYFFVKYGIMKGPVDFEDKEVGTVFIVLSYSKETGSAILAPRNEFGKTNDYLVDQTLEKGRAYELIKKPEGIFYLKETTV